MQLSPRTFWKDTRDALHAKITTGQRSLTLQIECGAGKTSLPSMLSYELWRAGLVDGIIWAVPRTNLVRSAANAMKPSSPYWHMLGLSSGEARRFEINALSEGNIPNPSRGAWGYAISYDALNSNLFVHLDFCRHRRVLLVSDETQFCAHGRPLGRMLERLQAASAFSLFMSGDFDRSDRARVACVSYMPKIADPANTLQNLEVVETDVTYSVYDALAERVILPLDFSYGSGRVEYRRGNAAHSVDLATLREDPGGVVWAAVNSEYGRQLLSEAAQSWRAHRADGVLPHRTVEPNPTAQLMVVAGDQRQARDVRDYMLRYLGFEGEEVSIAISDEPESCDALARFCRGETPAIVTVAMAYVGTDAPHVSHLAVLTHYRSRPWLHQMFARAWRRCPGVEYDRDYCVAFCPDDPLLVRAVRELQEAQQVGALIAQREEIEGLQGKAGTERSPLVIESSELTGWRHRTEFSRDYQPESFRTTSLDPDIETTRDELRRLGWSVDQIASMLRAGNTQTVERTLEERITDLGIRLETYQRRTVFVVAQRSGRQPSGTDFQTANRCLKAKMAGRSRDLWSEAEYVEALTVHAPQVRRELLLVAEQEPADVGSRVD